MIVLDASVVVEIVTNGPQSRSIGHALATSGESMIVPHLIDIEVVSALRRVAGDQRLDSYQIGAALRELATLPAERYPHAPLLGRIWQLRHNFTAYDATYIALAEAMNSALYTCDAKLAKGHHAKVVLFRQ